MSLATEIERLASIDMGGMKQTLDVSKSGINMVGHSLDSLGIATDDAMRYVNMATGSLQLAAGLLGIERTVKTVIDQRTRAEEAKAAGETAILSAIPGIGWGRIALATATMATAGAVMYGIVNTVKLGSFDLSTSSGQNDAVRAVQGVLA